MTELASHIPLESKSVPTLRDLLSPLFRRKRIFAFTFCGCIIGTILAAFLLASQHEAKMEILVDQERLDPKV